MKRDELSGSEAVFGFAAWLTTRKEKTVMSASNDSACIVDLIKDFCDTNKLTDPRDHWEINLKHPIEETGISQEVQPNKDDDKSLSKEELRNWMNYYHDEWIKLHNKYVVEDTGKPQDGRSL